MSSSQEMTNDGRGYFVFNDGSVCTVFKSEAGVPVGGGRRVTMVGEIKKASRKTKTGTPGIYEPNSKERQ